MAISEDGLREVDKDETQDEPHIFVFAQTGSQNDSGNINPCG